MLIPFSILMFILGAAFGSFLCCEARRLRERELRRRPPGPRSVCLHCHHQLKWYDNLPILSWLILRGKCRYCHRKIGLAEFLAELGLATAFLALGLHFYLTASVLPSVNGWAFPPIHPLNWAIFAITLLLTLSLGFLAIYDGAYGELPALPLTISIICAIIIVILRQEASLFVIQSPSSSSTPLLFHQLRMFAAHPWSPTFASLLAAALLGGLYLVLYLASHGRWVGDGDWLLATAIGLALGSPWLALIALLVANLTATLAYPLIKTPGSHQLHFGPFLVAAFVIVATFSDFFISVI